MDFIRKINSGILKIIALYILAVIVVISIYSVEKNTIYKKSTDRAAGQIGTLQASVIDQMSIIDELYRKQVTSSMNSLIRSGLRYGNPILGESVEFMGSMVPNLSLGENSVVGAYGLVDEITEDMDGTATLFVRADSGDFVRVSTNVKKSDGSRAVGTILTKGGAVERLILQDKAYYGIVDILGKPYFTGYEPMHDGDGEIIGIWYVGYQLEQMSSLGDSIAGKKVYENDISVILDAKDRIISKSGNVPDDEIMSLIGQADESDEWVKTAKDFESWGYQVISLYKAEDVETQAHQDSLRQLLKIGIIFVMFSAFIIYFVITTNRTNKKISIAAKKLAGFAKLVSSSAYGLSEASHQLSEGSAEQAAAIEETSATMDETSSMVQQNAGNAKEANNLSEEAFMAAQTGTVKVSEMTQSMDELKKSSSDIARIIRVIDDIAFQTNILALNAAVEAARAGDAGLGFAVVADEVRNLAQKSARAAKDTADIIDRNITLSEQGVTMSSDVNDSLNEIKDKVEKVNELIGGVTMASQEQAKGVEQVTGAIGQMEKVVQSTAASAEETNASAEELKKNAEGLTQVVTELNILVKGKNGKDIG